MKWDMVAREGCIGNPARVCANPPEAFADFPRTMDEESEAWVSGADPGMWCWDIGVHCLARESRSSCVSPSPPTPKSSTKSLFKTEATMMV